MTYPTHIEEKIGFQEIRTLLYEACKSNLGREKIDDIRYLSDSDAIAEKLAITREMMMVLQHPELSFPTGEICDVRESLHRIRIEGLFLDESELLDICKALRYAADLSRFFRNLDTLKYPRLCQLSHGQGDSIELVIRMADSILDRLGRLSDNASPEMHRIRHEMNQAQGAVGRILTQILKQAQANGLLDKDAQPTFREGRLVLPIPPSSKRKIGGIVHDESATGKTIFIEPQQVVEANNRIRELQGEERRERIRILTETTSRIRPLVPEILEASNLLATIDFLLAKCTVAHRLEAIVPEVVNKAQICLHDARHPLLYLSLKQQHREIVPLNLVMTDNRILIISGPNAGGKSVCLKTVALLQYMLQCGLPIPVREDSQLGIFENILIDIGDEQSIEDDLSTYSSHLRNMKEFVRHANPRTLFLIDEFGTGTEPLIGGAIAEAVLTVLNERQAYGVITTHYTNLKHFADSHEGVINGAMLYDRGALRPLFQLSIGQAGSSFAIEIAKQIGLSETIIQQATELIGSEHIDYDRSLQDIARDKRYWENKRDKIRQREKHLEERIAHYEQEIGAIKQKRREILDDANEKAANILAQSNATIERTIREIKEAKADKDKTKAARARVESQKAKVESHRPKEEKTDKRVLRDFRDLKPMAKTLPTVTKTIADTIRSRKLQFERTLDIRGMRIDEAEETLIAYIDDAMMVAAGEVTILHGTGTGALKQMVRDYLSRYNKARQKSGRPTIIYHDGDANTGGAGLTIIEF